MKPIELEISGWGPYKQVEKLQFDKLWDRGLFLVTGPTGAGKTTIFDAICFALYGSLSGQMREKNSVRSDFADSSTKTYVKLKMEHKGKVYEIYRNPEYLRPKKRKSGGEDFTKERENAVLMLPDGNCLEGAKEVTGKMQEILALDYTQFKQISMIAQGEFAKLLTETPAEKIKIFRKLFGTTVVEQFAQHLRTKSNKLLKEVQEYRHRMDEDVKLFQEEREEWQALAGNPDRNYDMVFSYLETLLIEYKELKKASDKAFEKAEKEEQKLSAKKAEMQRAREAAEKRKSKEELLLARLAQKELFTEKEKEAEQIRRAQLVEPFFIRLKNGKEQAEKLEQTKENLRKERERLKEQMRENRFFYENREALSALLSLKKERNVQEEKLQKEAERLKTVQAEQESLKAAYLRAENSTKECRERLEQAETAYRRSAIGIAAKLLQAGKPCPVCGSLEHPCPAETGEAAVDETVLKELREAYEAEHGNMLGVHEKAVQKQAELTAAEAEVEKGKEALESLREEEAKQREKITGEQEDKAVGYQAGITRKEAKHHTKTAAGEAAEEAGFREDGIRTQELLEEKIASYRNAEVLLKDKEAEEARVSLELTQVSEKVTGLTDAYKQAILENGLEEETNFLSHRERQGEAEKLLEECRTYQEEIKSLTDLVKHLKEEEEAYRIQNGSIAQENADDENSLEEKLNFYKEEKKRLTKEREKAVQRISEIKKTIQALKEKQESSARLEKEYGIVKDLDNLVSGNNTKRLVFEQFVLAAYFEQVLEAANVRFEKMTAGRYTMFRSTEVTDGRSKDNMEICVMDYYTGKARPVKTLSGGETFKASLALALGLSDVVGRTNGGIRVDTLFIDEGFGALDSESLEQACEALTSLVEKDRLIGIISHVAELRERIDDQIVVHKTSSGSRIENVLG